MLQGTKITTLSLGLILAFRPDTSLFENDVLVRTQDQPYRMLVDSNLIATEERCDTLFQRLRDFHPLIKILKLEVDAKIHHVEAGKVHKMISYQRTAARDTKTDLSADGPELRMAPGNMSQSFYQEYLVQCGQQLDIDLEPYRKSLVTEPREPIASAPSAPSEPSVPINRPGQSKLLDLPSELIAIIVRHLALMGPVKPFPPAQFKRPCACTKTGADSGKKWKALMNPISPVESTDPTLALSCVSQKLRKIAFEGRPNRTLTIGFCAKAMNNSAWLPLAMRKRVK